MGSADFLGILFVLALAGTITLLISACGLHPQAKRLIIAGLGLRIVGSLLYLYLAEFHLGGGDYRLYYRDGIAYAETIWTGDWAAISAPWLREKWWGTHATIHLSGFAFALIGPSLAALFMLFALIGYIGIIAFWVAFKRSFPGANHNLYLAWIVFFPTLWFWPAALGKDAIVLCGIGLATLGIVGKGSRTGWLYLAIGTLLVFAIRPQVATVLTFAFVAGHWITTARLWTFQRVMQGTTFLAIGTFVVLLASGTLGIQLFEQQEVVEYLGERSTQSAVGGSAVEVGDGGVPFWQAPMNIWLRPMPWEASSINALFASLEVLFLWAMIWYRRSVIAGFFGAHKNNRLMWVAIVFIAVYTLAMGMAVGNLGTMVRQRSHIFPFLFMFFAGLSMHRVLWTHARASASSRGVGRAVVK